MKALFSLFKYSFKVCKSYFILSILQIIVYLAKSLLLVYTPSIIISLIETSESVSTIIVYVVAIIVLNLLINFIYSYVQYAVSYKTHYISKMYEYLMANKILSINYQYLEDPYYLDLKERALFSAQNQGSIIYCLQSVLTMIQSIVTLLSLIGVLISLGPVLIIVVCSYLVVYTAITLTTMKVQKNFFEEIVPINRRFGYYFGTLNDRLCGADYRIYNGKKLVLNKLDTYQSNLGKSFESLYKKLGRIGAINGIVQGAIQGFVYFFVAFTLIRKKLQVSAFSLYTATALSFVNQSSSLITAVTGIIQNVIYLKPYMEILNLKNEEDEGKKIIFDTEIDTIEFQNVFFNYPRQEKVVLKDISFKINKGECISIVGLNGAGKTTLIKLLCRLYKPTSGNILINGINIFDYDINSYNKHISCVFQDFKLFGYSIKENITFDDVSDDEIAKDLQDVGVLEKVNSLPLKMHTPLDKQLSDDGAELSGGQTQKIAIARALHKNADLVILDEPTSALDPLSEAEIYENFNSLSSNKTSIYISHRMSSSTFCDKILVIDDGVVTDFDTHKNLMNKDCLYRVMFETQAENYKN